MTGPAHKRFHAGKLNQTINDHYCILLHALEETSGAGLDLQEALKPEDLQNFLGRLENALKCSAPDLGLSHRICIVRKKFSTILERKGIDTQDLRRPDKDLIHYFVRGDENVADYGNAAQLLYCALSYMEMSV